MNQVPRTGSPPVTTRKLTPYQEEIMRMIACGGKAVPASASVLTIDGKRACTVSTMKVLERSGLVAMHVSGTWARTTKGHDLFGLPNDGLGAPL